MFVTSRFLAVWSWIITLACCHTQITYPGERGNNLYTNGTLPQHDAGALGINTLADGTRTFPYGMQWQYPCGGMPLSTNRTFWPYLGGAISIQPGWFVGHSTAFFYINMGINGPGDVAPPNMSHIMVPPFQIVGPSDSEYTGQFCLPQVPMPANVTLKPGDNVTIQVIELAQHGAGLYNCVDLTLVDVHDPRLKPVTSQNCYNTSDISFDLVFTTQALSSDAISLGSSPSLLPVFIAGLVTLVSSLL